VTGSPAEPAKVGISVADIAGGMYAYSGILTALLQRERTGHGGVVRTSLFGALAEWMSHPMLLASLTGAPPARNGPRHATIVPYGSYLTADGGEILIAVQNEDEWARLCHEVVDLPELATGTRYAGNQRRVEHRDEVEDLLSGAIGRLTAAELVRRLTAARIAYAAVREVGEVVAHPQLAGKWVPVSAGGREVQMLPPPVMHSGFGPALGPVPRHGEHTDAVLAEFAAEADR
jgi:crotonobetainyl-CoA:carnitine CoA-transferase CaiB-like acyl-CoA transferase